MNLSLARNDVVVGGGGGAEKRAFLGPGSRANNLAELN